MTSCHLPLGTSGLGCLLVLALWFSILATGFTPALAAATSTPSDFRCHCNNWPMCLSSCRADVAVAKAMVESRATLGYRVFTATYVVCSTPEGAPLKQCVRNEPYDSYSSSVQLSLYIDASDLPIVLSLTKADFIAPRGHFQLRYTHNGQQVLSDKISRCLYEGAVTGDLQSQAFVDVCSDRLRGIIRYKGADYIIQPIDCYACPVYMPHAVLPVAQDRKFVDAPDRPIVRDPAVKTFFAPFTELLSSKGGQSTGALLDSLVASDWPSGSPPSKDFSVQLAVVIDYALFCSLGRSLTAASALAGRIVGQANRLLADSRVSLSLKSLDVWNYADRRPLGGSLRAGLLTALGLTREPPLPTGESLLLLSGANYSTSSDHLSVLDSVCSGRAASIVRVGGSGGGEWPRTARLAALAVAEQLGMLALPCPTGGDCSPDRLLTRSDAQRLEAALRSGTANCLLSRGRAQPSAASEIPVCGNGRLERSEECDPGADLGGSSVTEGAAAACCDKAACVLHSWATCRGGSGACCSGCALRPAGSICRAAAGDCDLPELCDGSGETCPDDAGLADWQPCGAGGKSSQQRQQQRLCRSGQCPPGRDSACSQVWGSGAVSGPVDCYISSGRDACAALMCSGGSGGGGGAANELTVRRPNETSLTCRFQSPDAQLPDGTPCPGGGSCSAGRCLSPASLAAHIASSVACPRGGGGSDSPVCSGRGVCTTRAACLCQPGWTGAACQSRAARGEPVDPLQLHYWAASPAESDSGSGAKIDDKAERGMALSIEMICIIGGAILLALILAAFVAYTCHNRRLRLSGGRNGIPLWNSSSSQQGNRLTAADATYGYGLGSSAGSSGSKRRRQKNDLGEEVGGRTTIKFAPPPLQPLQQQQPLVGHQHQQLGLNSLDSSTMGSGKQQLQQPSLRQPPSDPPLPDKGILRNREVGELQEMANLLDKKLGRRSGSASTLEDEYEARYGGSEQPPGKSSPPVIFCNSSMQTDKTPKHQPQPQPQPQYQHQPQPQPPAPAYLECLPESERYQDTRCGGSGGSGGSYSNANAYSCPYAPGSVGSGCSGGKLAASPSNLLAGAARKPDAEKGPLMSLPAYATAPHGGHYSDGCGSSVCGSSVCGGRGSGCGSVSGWQPPMDLAIVGGGLGGSGSSGGYLGKR